jgi:hypothetical protein
MPVRVSIKSRLSTSWLNKTEKNSDNVALQMVTDVDRFAKVLAPKDKGNLVNSGRIEKIGNAAYKASFGGSGGGVSVRYAKRRHYENKKNPHTLGYLKRAGNAVARAKDKYLKGERPKFK